MTARLRQAVVTARLRQAVVTARLRQAVVTARLRPCERAFPGPGARAAAKLRGGRGDGRRAGIDPDRHGA